MIAHATKCRCGEPLRDVRGALTCAHCDTPCDNGDGCKRCRRLGVIR